MLPWDKEMTFGSPQWPIFQYVNDNVLLRRALQVPALRQRYLDTMHEAAEAIGGPGGWLETEVNREYSVVRDAVILDPARVCLVDGAQARCPIEFFDANVAYVRRFAQDRAAFVNAALAAEGSSLIHGAHHVQRGYENIDRKFQQLGASITRSADPA